LPGELFNDQEIKLNLDVIKHICDAVLLKEGREENVNIVFVKIDEIENYNRSYRKKHEPTDVLSFTYGLPELLGEVYVCPEYVKENAKEFGVTFNEELLRVCIHGLLHLCGYDHEKDEESARQMFDRQESYLSYFSDSFDKIS
jgi:probable rRNA maturation factor